MRLFLPLLYLSIGLFNKLGTQKYDTYTHFIKSFFPKQLKSTLSTQVESIDAGTKLYSGGGKKPQTNPDIGTIFPRAAWDSPAADRARLQNEGILHPRTPQSARVGFPALLLAPVVPEQSLD